MKTKNIQKINEALYVLRNFIDLSAQLLPFLIELKYTKKPTQEDLEDQQKIIEVFKNYEFDNTTAKLLMNSQIIDIIHSSYQVIVTENETKTKAKKHLKKFFQEHKRLKNDWAIIDAN
jgi:hypothetical protein